MEQIDPRVMKSLQDSESCKAQSSKKNQLTLVELQAQRGSKVHQFCSHGHALNDSNQKAYSISSHAYKDGTLSGQGGVIQRKRPRLMSARPGGY